MSVMWNLRRVPAMAMVRSSAKPEFDQDNEHLPDTAASGTSQAERLQTARTAMAACTVSWLPGGFQEGDDAEATPSALPVCVAAQEI